MVNGAKLLAVIFGIFLILAPSVQEAVLLFIIGGIIPGTDIELPIYAMLATLLLCLLLIIAWVRRQQFYLQPATQTKSVALSTAAKSKPRTPATTSPAERRRLANRSA